MSQSLILLERIQELSEIITKKAEGVSKEKVEKALETQDYFSLLEDLIPLRPKGAESIAALEELLRIKTFSFPPPGRNNKPFPIVFGTSGHRGEIGLGLSLAHIHAIVSALILNIHSMTGEDRKAAFGSSKLEEVKEKGIVLGHDNRLFNEEFSFYSAYLLRREGYQVFYAGRVASPEFSSVVPRMGWAGAINFTPSHNPFRYGGVKFNPADGGMADTAFTDPLATEANRVLETLHPNNWMDFHELEKIIAEEQRVIERVDVHGQYLKGLSEHPIIALNDLTQTLKAMPEDEAFQFVADPVWGGAVPIYERLSEWLGKNIMEVIHTEDDPYFGGQTTEPNEETLTDATQRLKASSNPFKVAIRNDPDGDRGLVGDTHGAIPMNQFAVMVMRYLIDIGHGANVVTTFPSSGFGKDYARKEGKTVFQTAVGFKNFRNHILDNKVMVAYEESDGITIADHTLDKDGILAGLLGLRMVLHYKKSLGEQLAELETQMGPYYYLQESFAVSLTAKEVQEGLKGLVSVKAGDVLGEGEQTRKVTEVNTEDGFLFTFEEGAWLMMRPSGTEPKVRVYAETRESDSATQNLCQMGQKLALNVLNIT